jgi:tetratricopeptide (TPR) repeat protein
MLSVTPRHQLVETRDLVIGDATEDIGQPCLWINAIQHKSLARNLYLEGRNGEALAVLDRALADRPDKAYYFISTRAHVLAALGRTREALDEFERALQAGGKDFVRMYQKALARHGYYHGAIDGAYGPSTRAALAA